MRYIIILFIVFMAQPVLALDGMDRYMTPNKVLYEDPREDDVLLINTAVGYSTVLEFPQKPAMVTTGDSSLLQIEVPKNSSNVLIKALRGEGETNLFVFTPSQRFNYKVIVGSPQDADYVVDVQKESLERKNRPSQIPITQLVKMAQNYKVLLDSKQINGRIFVEKDIFSKYENPFITLKVLEAYANKAPHYLILHFSVYNKQSIPINLNEKITNVYVNGHKFRPDYVLFDADKLEPKEGASAWAILKGTNISLNNHFSIGVGVYDKEHIF